MRRAFFPLSPASFLLASLAPSVLAFGCAAGSVQHYTIGTNDGSIGDGGSDDSSPTNEASTDDGGSGDSAGETGETGSGGACTTDDDCTAPDLCTNARKCVKNVCVVIGGAPSCDDGIACTHDSCDATAGKCKHVPDDTLCTGSQFCDAKTGCVSTIACAGAGDSTCTRLNDDLCKGEWKCDDATKTCRRAAPPDCSKAPLGDSCSRCAGTASSFKCTHDPIDYGSDVNNCGGCGIKCNDGRANVSATCSVPGGGGDAGVDGGSGGLGVCAWTCQTGYVDTAGASDLDAPLGTTPTPAGCTCKLGTGPDVPDLTFTDKNCDGIVGDIAHAIFVSPSGSDTTGDGSMAKPYQTIAKAISAASSAGKDVYADKGTYNESVSLVSGVSLYGGYDSTKKWSRAKTNVSTIQSASTVGVTASGISVATEVQLFTVTSIGGADGTGGTPAGSSYAVLIANCSAAVTIRGCTLKPGAGGAASGGSVGSSPGAASGGTAGSSGGAGGASTCGAGGGSGGPSEGSGGSGVTGGTGSTAAGGGTGSAGGAGSSTSSSCGSGGNGGDGNPATTAGGAGSPGSNGSGAGAFGSISAAGLYTPADGSAGTAGTPGGGGGGGGSGGGNGVHDSTCVFGCCGGGCASIPSGAGGGGGAGGCGGGPGGGGKGGGGSFGVVIVSSTATVDQCTVTTGKGGAGGNGGDGGAGGTHGSGAAGGPRATRSNCGSSYNSGGGGSGADGGDGGKGGGGGGGTGGPSVCVYYVGTPPTYSGNTCVRGGGGSGGTGGTGATTAPAGQPGLSAEESGA